jgi:hypothetical protein
MDAIAASARRPLPALLAAALLASCGGLENPDLSTGALEGRIVPSYPGGRVYLFGRPDLACPLAADGSFYLVVPVGPAVLVALDGADRAGLVSAIVRGAEVTRVGSVAPDGPIATPGNDALLALPPAGWIEVAATSSAGVPILDASFTLDGTDQREIAPSTSTRAILGPLPAGTFDLRVRAPGFAEAKERIEVLAGQRVVHEVTLAPAAR